MEFTTHLYKTVLLAIPMVIARAGLLVMVAVDTAMVGHYGTTPLAHYAASNALQIVIVLVGVGLSQGTVIMVAQAKGAGNDSACGKIWRVGLIQGSFFGILMGLICFLGEPLLLLFGQTQSIATGGSDVLIWISWGFPAFMIWATTGFFLEGLGKPLPAMISMIGAVVLNAILNWIFIFGELGAPEMGAQGAAITTSIVRWLMMLVLVSYVFIALKNKNLGITGPFKGFFQLANKYRKIGFPLGIARGLEAASFSALTMFAGWISTISLAGYQIAFNLIALAFMCAIGIAGASTVRVGNAVGKNDMPDLKRAGLASIVLVVSLMTCVMAVYLSLSDQLAKIYTKDIMVSGIAAGLIGLAGIVLIFDGLQAVLMGCLRGSSDVWIPSLLQLIAWWGLTIPIAWILAFHADLGVKGLMWAFLIGAIAASLMLGIRFIAISKRPGNRF